MIHPNFSNNGVQCTILWRCFCMEN